jgi:hypothetical protein
MARKKMQLVNVLLGAAARHGRESDPDHEVGDLQGIVQLCWSLLTKEQREAIGIAALDPEGLDLARWMKPKRLEFGGVKVERF